MLWLMRDLQLFNTNLYEIMSDDALEEDDSFDIAYDGTTLSEEDWPTVLRRAQRMNVRLTVQTRYVCAGGIP